MANFRNPYVQPFASDSIWNTPIGSGAVYGPSNLSRPIDPNNSTDTLWAPMPQVDPELIVLSPTSPQVTISYSNVGWNAGDRCTATGGSLDSVPIPDSYVIPDGPGNNSASFLNADRRSVAQNQPFTRCTAGGGATAIVSFADQDFYGSGITGAHGGSGLSALGGSLRLGELRPGQQGPRHALKVNVYAKQFLYPGSTLADCYRWPAISADGYAVGFYGSNSNATNTSNPQMKMGALLAIPPSTNIANLGLVTEPAKQLAWTLQNYGAYIVDDTYSPAWCWNVEDGLAGSKLVEFANDYGFAFEQRYVDNATYPWINDQIKLIGALQVVTNNSPTSIGGGGTPRQALADPLSGSFIAENHSFSNSATNITLGVPSGAVNGNFLLAAVSCNGVPTTCNVTGTGGHWTLIDVISTGATTADSQLYVFWGYVASGDSTSFTFTLNGTSPINGFMWALKDVDIVSPINVKSKSSGTGTIISHSSVTPTVNNTLLLAISSQTSNTGSLSVPPFWTSRNGVGTGSNVQCSGATASYYDTAATGNLTSTSGANAKWASQLIALAPQTTVASSPLFVTGTSSTTGQGKMELTIHITL